MSSSLLKEPNDVCGIVPGASKTVLNSPNPVTKYCYDCRKVVWTKIKYYPTIKTRVMAITLSPCLLCWVPFFCHWKAELDHHCSFCNRYLGTFNPNFEKKNWENLKKMLPKKESEPEIELGKEFKPMFKRFGDFKEPFSKKEEFVRMFGDVLT